MNKHRIIGVDIDDTLIQSYELYLKIMNPRHGLDIKYDQISTYYLGEIPEVAHITCDWYGEYQDMLSFEHDRFLPVEGSQAGLKHLKDSGDIIHAITARRPLHKENTDSWMRQHFPGVIDNIHYLGTDAIYRISKAEMCQSLRVDYMIEDHIDHCLDLANHGIPSFLLERPWNRHRTEQHLLITRVASWGELVGHLN